MPNDVRMKGFSRRTPVRDAIQWIDDHSQTLDSETVDLSAAAGRVLANDLISQVNVPGFRRAMMDGYAVIANDVLGASGTNPITLKVIGEILPGQVCQLQIVSGSAVRVMTGAQVPDDATAVIPVEHTESSGDDCVDILTSIAEQKHIGAIGEDIARNGCILRAGRILRPQDAGLIASVGVAAPTVIRRPNVKILVTGNELLPPGTPARGVQIVDSNSPMLTALIQRDGGNVIHPGILPDNRDAILQQMESDCDVLLIAGGSSTGKEDFAPQLLAEHGNLQIHGIAMRPSSPAGMGTFGNKIVFLLPGNPVSCLCAYDFFAGRSIRQLGGQPAEWPYRVIRRPLAQKISSPIGRTDYSRVRLQDDQVIPLGVSGASILSSVSQADGFCLIEEDCEGYPEGTDVEIFLYD